MTCDICGGGGTITLPTRRELSASYQPDYDCTPDTAGAKVFDCPQCAPMVPYRRVRATKVATQYDATEFGKFQVPVERALAAKFGEFLYREGLIKFSTDSLDDFTKRMVTVTAHLGVVSPADVRIAGATPEVALTPAPPLPKKLTRQQRERVKVRPGSVEWTPRPAPWEEVEAAAEFETEPKDAIANRFSGLEI